MARRSNCHLEAWRAYRRGHAAALCFHPTRYSTAARIAGHPLLAPLRWLATAVQWLAWAGVQTTEFLRCGRWFHVTWVDGAGRRWEFVPAAARRPRLLPPLLFRGQVQPVADPEVVTPLPACRVPPP